MRLVPYVCGAAVAASLMAASTEARADVIPISVAARIGYEKFTGDDGKNTSYLPIQIDALYNVGFGLHVGAYGSYAPAISKPDGVDSSTLTRVGAQAIFKLGLPLIHPWVGVGTGYEHLSSSGGSGALKVESSASGWEHFNLQGGVQFSLLPLLELGPYVQFEQGKFSSASVKVNGVEQSGSSNDDGHGRYNFGLRAELSF